MEKLQINYTPRFLSDLRNPENQIEVFYIKLMRSSDQPLNDNPIEVATDRLNEDFYVIQVDNDSLGVGLSADGLRFSFYSNLNVYYKLNRQYKLAATIPINQNGNSVLFDYTCNFIYLDLTEFGVVARLKLIKLNLAGTGKDNTYGVVLSHKHTLIPEYSETDPVEDNTYSSDCILEKLYRENNLSYVRYLSYLGNYSFPLSSDNNFYISAGIVNANELIKKNAVPFDYTCKNSTKEVYQFKNSFIALLGIELAEISPERLYDKISRDYELLISAIGDLTYDLSSNSFTINAYSTDPIIKTLVIDIQSNTEYDSNIISTSPVVSVNKIDARNYELTFYPTEGLNLEGTLQLKVWDEERKIENAIPWIINWRI